MVKDWQHLLASWWASCAIAVAILAPGLVGAAVLASSAGGGDAGGGKPVVVAATRTSTSRTAAPRSPAAPPAQTQVPLETAAPTAAPAQPTPEITIVEATPPPAPQQTAPPAPQVTARPSALAQWNECQLMRNQGTEVESIKNQFPGRWNSDYERQYQDLINYDQANCIGIGGSLAETDGNIHCPSILSSAASLQTQMQQFPGLQSWYFPSRNLDELRGYINAAEC